MSSGTSSIASIVLIASAEHLPTLKARADLEGSDAFPDTEWLKGLEVITRTRPIVVALDRLFATSSRGAALINRIMADPTLGVCDIRILAHDTTTPGVPKEGTTSGVEGEQPPQAIPQALLDQRGTRRARRFKMVDGVEVMVDGKPVTLVDLSRVGAQVISHSILKPNQRLRMSIPDRSRQVRFGVSVAWASLEIRDGGTRYRAGLEFFEADEDAIQRFCESRKRPDRPAAAGAVG